MASANAALHSFSGTVPPIPIDLFFAASCVTAAVSLFVSFEVGAVYALFRLGFLATFWRWTFVAVLRVESVIHVSSKVFPALEPRTYAHEHVRAEPFQTVVATRSTVIWSVVIVTIGTVRGCYAGDRNLRVYLRGARPETQYSNRNYQQNCKSTHEFTSL